MVNEKLLKSLIEQNNQLIKKYETENNAKALEKHNLISSILVEDSAFEKMDIAVALNIIVDITGDSANAFDVYKKLMTNQN